MLESLTRLVKNSAGLDPRFLFIGSEGTLGIITRLVLKLQPPPGPTVAAIAALPDMVAVAKLLRHLKQTLGGMLHAYEFMSQRFVELSSSLSGVRNPVDPQSPWAVLIEARGVQGQTVDEQLQAALERAFEAELISDCAVASSLSDVESFWRLRQSIPELLTHLKPTVNFDCGLPLKQIPDFVERVEAALKSRFPKAEHLFFGHLGDNNLHLMTGPHDEQDNHTVDELVYRELQGHHRDDQRRTWRRFHQEAVPRDDAQPGADRTAAHAEAGARSEADAEPGTGAGLTANSRQLSATRVEPGC